jgi:hypothetical protein
MRIIAILTVVLATLTVVARAQTPTTGPATRPAIDPVADHVLRQSCEFLAQTKAFSVHAEIWKDEVLPSGHKIQVTRSVEMELRRPDRLHVEQRAHHRGRSIWYDGKTVTVMDREVSTYGVADAPATVDETLDVLAGQYGITVPLEDLAVADPYGSAIKNAIAGGYFGDEPVLGVSCRHIGFSTEQIDWQVWVADGAQPLPQKLVITYKNEEQSPQYIAIFSKWALTGRAADLAFEFLPPRGSERVPLISEGEKEKPQVKHETDHH